MKKNKYIELCRFIAAIVIFFHHTNHIGMRLSWGGWIMVEYFFILTGYFTAKHFLMKEIADSPEKAGFQYSVKKVNNILPYATVGLVLSTLLIIIKGDVNWTNIGDIIAEFPLHLFMLKASSFIHFDINSVLWFMTGIIIILPLMIILLQKKKEFALYYASWAIPIISYIFLYQWHGQLQYWSEGVSLHLIIRSAAGLFLGVAVYGISTWLSSISLKKETTDLLTIIELALFFAIVVLSFYTDFCVTSVSYVFWIVVSLSITFSGKGFPAERLPKWTVFLGKLSVPLFCVHAPVLMWIQFLLPDIPFVLKTILGLAVSLGISFALVLLHNRKKEKAMRGISFT